MVLNVSTMIPATRKLVVWKYPDANCVEWKGVFLIKETHLFSAVLGRGNNEVEAWHDAYTRVKQELNNAGAKL